jgi:hypothetical protein
MCAMIAHSPGYRASTAPNGPGPVCSVPTGACPACTTTGTPASASSPHTSSSCGSMGENPPTCKCTLKIRAPAATASATYPATPGSG